MSESEPRQRFVEWRPIDSVPPSLSCWGVEYVGDGLSIILRDSKSDGPDFRIRFPVYEAFRIINESNRYRLLAELDSALAFPLLKIEDSSWVRWLVDESGALLQPEDVTHFVILTIEKSIEFVVREEPDVEWLG